MEPSFEHFSSIPWCQTLLSDPAWIITPTFSRTPKPHQGDEDSLSAETLNTSRTIPHCLSLYLKPSTPNSFITSLQTLVTLSSGMNGGPNMLHGGIIATLIDDVIGTLLTVNKESKGDGKQLPLTANTVTAFMNVKYSRPVMTPQTVLVLATCRERKERKFFVDGEVRDGDGVVLAKCESLWIRLGRPQL